VAIAIAVASSIAAVFVLALRDDSASEVTESFELVGHSSLGDRGMNAALALFDHYAYVGNRTDGSEGHPHPGVLVVDIADAAAPSVVGEIGLPHAATRGESTRELRVWPDRALLVVMTIPCSAELHDCAFAAAGPPSRLTFFDLETPTRPRYMSSYVPRSAAGSAVESHEMFLWVDPADDARALLWLSTPTESSSSEDPNLLIVDISEVPTGGRARTLAQGNWNDRIGSPRGPASVHSMSPAADGATTYLAYLGGGVVALDTRIVRRSSGRTVVSLDDRLLTDPSDHPTWPNAVAHSAVQIPGSTFVLATDEVYGTYADPSGGCPWGWIHILNFASARRPALAGEFKLRENEGAFCTGPEQDEDATRYASFASHNPTILPGLAFVTWYAAGLRAIDISDPFHPVSVGQFIPTPVEVVATEDPALTQGQHKVAMWSYPIVKDGLVYVVDLRNGLYVLRYTGPRAESVRRTRFLEGNSNLGDAVPLARG
jgi:hypothetical protein